jgi:hypothetical protein
MRNGEGTANTRTSKQSKKQKNIAKTIRQAKVEKHVRILVKDHGHSGCD